jgi:hypothetical protein
MIRIIKTIYIELYRWWLCISWGLADMCTGFSWKTADYIISKVEEKRRVLNG